MKTTYARLAALLLIVSSIAFMAVSIYLMITGMALASIVSLASGLLSLGGGINIFRAYMECGEDARRMRQ